MRIYNTLTRKIEDFKSIEPSYVGMYTCGPTVYDFMHIGNLRTFVLSDLLLRTLKFNGYKVKAIQNITDIDDKIIKRAKEGKLGILDVVNRYTKSFLEDIEKLNISIEDIVSPKATDYIPQMISYIKDLVKKGFAYERDGSVYFDISKFGNYGKLSGVSLAELKTGTRSLSDNYTKDNVADFALWKKDEDFGVKSSWGKGRPGWHIECSVMSQENLGETFDIHVGGADLIFPHHENEIAQSEATTGKKFVNYFVHGAHLLVDGQKMSKSLNNFYTLKDIESKGSDPLALRYLYLQTHYRQEMNFTWEALKSAQNALDKVRNEISDWPEPKIGCAEYEQRFKDAITDDLNMPKALSVVWELMKSDYPNEAKFESLLKFDKVLGLDLKRIKDEGLKIKELEIPEDVQKLIKEREEYRKGKRYHLADQWRNKIRKLGFDIEDKEEGTVITKRG
ncbi:MAG: cysteine--tRNA ligase [Candidatus Levybacteria bacterium]|nr:cysteine--tRNA ligase [Candidatus Levybacteria bacterium]